MTAETVMTPVHPGEIPLEEFLGPLGVSQYQLAKAVSMPARRINEIVHGQRRITADTALRLARYFGTKRRKGRHLRLPGPHQCQHHHLARLLFLPGGQVVDWLRAGLLICGVGILGFQVGVWAVRLASLSAGLGLDPAALGAVITVAAAAGLVTLFAGGTLADRVGRRPVLVIGFAGAGTAFVLLALAGSLAGLIPAVLLYGLSVSFVDLGANTVGSAYEQAYAVTAMTGLHAWFSADATAGAVGSAAAHPRAARRAVPTGSEEPSAARAGPSPPSAAGPLPIPGPARRDAVAVPPWQLPCVSILETLPCSRVFRNQKQRGGSP